MSNAYIGSNNIKGLYIGNQQVSLGLQGDKLIYEGWTQGLSFSKITSASSPTTLRVYSSPAALGTTSEIYITNKACSSITNPVGNIYTVTALRDNAFNDCTGISSVQLPNTITTIGNRAFQNCTSLSNITIPDSTTFIGNYAFGSCFNLTSITIPDNVTSIGEYAFFGCGNLTSITIPNSVTSIGVGVFMGCRGLTSVTIPDSVTSIGNSAFAYCRSLKRITIPDSATSIKSDAFANCSNVSRLDLDNVTGGSLSIGASAFSYLGNNTSGTTVHSPSSSVNTTLGSSAFANSKIGTIRLNTLNFPASVFENSSLSTLQLYCSSADITFNSRALYNCTKLSTISFAGTLSSWNNIVSRSDAINTSWRHQVGVDVTGGCTVFCWGSGDHTTLNPS